MGWGVGGGAASTALHFLWSVSPQLIPCIRAFCVAGKTQVLDFVLWATEVLQYCAWACCNLTRSRKYALS